MKQTTQNFTKTKTWLARITLHTFLCWTLALWQVIPTTAYADSTLEGQSTTVSGNQSDSNPSTSANSSSSGTLVRGNVSDDGKGNVTTIEGKNSSAKGKFLYSNIAIIATGLMAPTLAAACWDTWSVRVFTLSAVIYVANEIGLFSGFNKAINREMKAYKGRGDEEKQIDSLESASKQTREAKKAAEKRAKFAKLAATGFTIAAVVAVAERLKWWDNVKPCAGLGLLDSNPLSMDPPRSIASNTKEVFEIDNILKNDDLFGSPQNFSLLEREKNFHSDIVADFSLRPIKSENSAYGKRKKGGISDLFVNAIVSNAYAETSPETDSVREDRGLPSITEVSEEDAGNTSTRPNRTNQTSRESAQRERAKTQKTVTVNAVSEKMAALGLGTIGGLIVMNAASSAITTAFVEIASVPTYRAIGFGVFAAVAAKASSEAQDAANKLETRATEYDKLANSLRTPESQGIDTEGGRVEQYIDPSTQAIDGSGGGIGNNSVCFKGSGAKGVTPTDCSCSKTDTCAGPDLPSSTGIPTFSGSGLLTNGLNNLGGAAKDLFKGDLKGATTKGNKLVNGAARITRLKKALLDKLNEDRVKQGGKPIDFERAEGVALNRFERDINKAFSNLPPRGVAALNGIRSGLGVDDDSEKEKKDGKGEGTGVDTGKVAAVDINPNAGGASGKSNSGATWDFNFQDDAAAAAAEQDAMAAALAEEEDQNYKVDGDINDDRNKNLFNIITRRYLKSAYPVIFEEK